ncbi:FAD:protein FMN transferase [Halomonas sp. NO4]|uniref:FAD:protein FMN transferase n=1 Tax=Halomonas sp. NO4 TaxID=2484813 RepID=UPI0013D00222|nr:FAD:protein FMN transferase [Halomonas sp. NO4]
MIPLAVRRHPGLAHRGPALFMFLAVVMPIALLSACRHPSQEHQFQGAALDTGYHLTLYADLDAAARDALRADIQGELERLEQHYAWLRWLAVLPGWTANPADARGLAPLMHARAVDRLAERLQAQGVEHAMIEVGGQVRTFDHPRRQGWRLALDHAALPEDASPSRLRLRHAALVTRLGANDLGRQGEARLLAVNAVAPTATQAWLIAEGLAFGASSGSLDRGLPAEHAVRVVVSTPTGIESHHTPSLESWLER